MIRFFYFWKRFKMPNHITQIAVTITVLQFRGLIKSEANLHGNMSVHFFRRSLTVFDVFALSCFWGEHRAPQTDSMSINVLWREIGRHPGDAQ